MKAPTATILRMAVVIQIRINVVAGKMAGAIPTKILVPMHQPNTPLRAKVARGGTRDVDFDRSLRGRAVIIGEPTPELTPGPTPEPTLGGGKSSCNGKADKVVKPHSVI